MRLLRRLDPRFFAWVLLWAVVESAIFAAVGLKMPALVSVFFGAAAGVLSPWRLTR